METETDQEYVNNLIKKGQEARQLLHDHLIQEFLAQERAESYQALENIGFDTDGPELKKIQQYLLVLKRFEISLQKHIDQGKLHLLSSQMEPEQPQEEKTEKEKEEYLDGVNV